MKRLLLIVSMAWLVQAGGAQTDVPYLGQTPPGDTAVMFGKGIVSNGNSHTKLVISPDGREIFWNVMSLTTMEVKMISSSFKDGKWSDPQTPPFASKGSSSNAVFSPDGRKLFYQYRENTKSAWSVYYVEKTDLGWSAPKNDGFLLKAAASLTSNGKAYFSDPLASSPWGNGIFSADVTAAGLSNIKPLPEVINPANIINYTPCIAPDDSFLLFSSNRPRTGGNDTNMYLHVSFNDNGAWSEPQKINDAIGFSGRARFPSISPDGKYLFFCADDNNYYWVSLEPVRKMNPKK